MAPVKIAFTLESTRPRLLAKSTELSALQSRSNNSNGWQPWWDNRLTPWAASPPATSTFHTISFNLRMLGLCLKWWIDGDTDARDAGLTRAEYYADNIVTNGSEAAALSTTNRREALLAMSYAYDFFHSETTAAQKAKIGDCIVLLMDAADPPLIAELMDGFSRNNMMATLHGGLALQGESGAGYDYTSGGSDVDPYIDRAIDFWYGGNASTTKDGYAALDTERYFHVNGGRGKGTFYSMRSDWGMLQLLHVLDRSTATLTLDSETYNPFTSEMWIDDMGLWPLHLYLRGDGDYFKIGDTNKISEPYFQQELRFSLIWLIAHGTYKREIRWLYDQWQAKAAALGQDSTSVAYNRALDFVIFDLADGTAQPRTPEAAGINKTQFFEVPGLVVSRSTWEHSKATIAVMNCPRYFYLGHQDLEYGSIQIAAGTEMVLLNTGVFISDDTGGADFGGSHNNNWQRNSISKSGVPLIDDGTALPHRNRDHNGTLQFYPSGEGGCYYRTRGGDSERDPENVTDMIAEGSALGWQMCEGRTATKGMEEIFKDSNAAFYYVDTHRAYLNEDDDLDTASDRLQNGQCDIKTLIFQERVDVFSNFGPDVVIFRVVRVKSRLASFQKQDVWHASGTVRFKTHGTHRAVIGGSPTADCTIDYYNGATLFDFDSVGGGGSVGNGYFANQFFFDAQDGNNGTNYPPGKAINTSRHSADIGLRYARVRPKTQNLEDTFVYLILSAPPAYGVGPIEDLYTWNDDPDFYSVTFNKTGRVYKISKTEVDAVAPTEPVDVTAPAKPTGLNATTPASGTVGLSWNPNTEEDLASYQVERRVKV